MFSTPTELHPPRADVPPAVRAARRGPGCGPPRPVRLHALEAPRWLLRGVGVEIGAHTSPLPAISPFQVDLFQSYSGAPGVAQWQGDAQRLPFRDCSLDYVATSHVLEHVANPIGAFREWIRVLRHRGIIYLVVPDRRRTWDHPRAPTTIEHFFADDANGTAGHDSTHIDEFIDGIDWALVEPDLAADARHAKRERIRAELHATAARGEDVAIHHHVFDPTNLFPWLDVLRTHPSTRFDWRLLDQADCFPDDHGNGLLAVLEVRKPWPDRLLGWRHRRSTRSNPLWPLRADATRFPPPPAPTRTVPIAPDQPSPPTEIDEVLRREATFRLQTIQNFRKLDTLIQDQRCRIESLEIELGERNGYIHQLHQQLARLDDLVASETALQQKVRDLYEQIARLGELEATATRQRDELDALHRTLAGAREDAAQLIHRLARAEDALAQRDRQLAAAQPFWRRARARAALPAPVAPLPPAPPVGSFRCHIEDPLYRLFPAGEITLRGWILSADGERVDALRGWLGADPCEVRRGSWGADESPPEDGVEPADHFVVVLRLASGRHQLRLEARCGTGPWLTVVEAPVFVSSP